MNEALKQIAEGLKNSIPSAEAPAASSPEQSGAETNPNHAKEDTAPVESVRDEPEEAKKE